MVLLQHLISFCTNKSNMCDVIWINSKQISVAWVENFQNVLVHFSKKKSVSKCFFLLIEGNIFAEVGIWIWYYWTFLIVIIFSVFSDTANEFSKSHFSPERYKINGSKRVNETNTNKSQITLRFELFASKLF
jgi:hypothetical protein